VTLKGVTRSDVVTAFEIVVLIGQLIRHRKEIPAGELYSDIMVHWPTLTANGFNQLIQKLIDAKCVKRSNHLLTWIGPEGEADNG
jgi:hypothetical protein